MLMVQPGEIEGIAEALVETERDVTTTMRQLAEYIGTRAIDFVKALTSELRPPARKANGQWTGWRKAHPGHWGDVTGVLVNSYGHSVTTEPGRVTLELRNTASYAESLEKRDNFWVLEGIAEDGGPVEKALREGAAIIDPSITVESYD